MDQLEGNVGVITGSASGLGRGMAERFAQEGMTVVIADNRLSEAQLVAEQIIDSGGNAVPIEVDVTNRDSLEAMADRVDSRPRRGQHPREQRRRRLLQPCPEV